MDSKDSLDEVLKKMILSRDDGFVVGHDELEVEETTFEQAVDWTDIEPQLRYREDSYDPDYEMNLSFGELSARMVDIGYDEKIKKMYLREGEGDFVSSTAIVYIHYNMYFEMEPVPFDSTTLRSSFPEQIKLGNNRVIPGLELAILTMKKGEKSQFIIHPDLAFGQIGAPPRIPPDAWILAVIDLEDFVDGLTDEESEYLEKNDKFSVCFPKCETLTKEGNFFFKNDRIKSALLRYNSARDLLYTATPETDDDKNKKRQLYIRICQNIMICLNKKGEYKQCCTTAKGLFQNYFEEANRNPKLHYQYAKALLSLCEFDMALKHIKMALALEPTNFEIGQLLANVTDSKSSFESKEKNFYKKGLDLNNDHPFKRSYFGGTETEQIIRGHLLIFRNTDNPFMSLPPGLTEDEIDMYKKICKEMDFEFKTDYKDDKVIYFVKKCRY